MNQIDLQNRIAVITGGCGGIGLATADRMKKSGATVVLWDFDRATLDKTLSDLPDTSGDQVDVTDEASVERATAQAIERFGRIDILVNAAGITSRRTAVVEFSRELWQKILDVNLTGTFLCCKAVVPHMQRENFGRIVNLG